MGTIAFAAPIMPGKVDVHRELCESFAGPRKAEYDASRKALGITKELVWHQQTPNGTLAVVVIEADDVATVFQRMATADTPFDKEFAQQVAEIHGMDLNAPPPPPTQIVF